MDNKLSELSKPVAWKFKEHVWATGLCGYVWRDKLEEDSPGAECESVKDINPLYSQEYVSALLQRIEELEAKLATPVIGSCDSDPMREYFTCTREGDFYFTTLGSVPDRTHTLYRNEAEALFIGLRDALSASGTVEGDA